MDSVRANYLQLSTYKHATMEHRASHNSHGQCWLSVRHSGVLPTRIRMQSCPPRICITGTLTSSPASAIAQRPCNTQLSHFLVHHFLPGITVNIT